MAYVYRFKDKFEKVIYVGYTGQTLDKRMGQHFEKGHLPKICYNSIAKIEYIKYSTKSDAMIMETYFINKYKPIYNKLNKQNDAITLDLEVDENWKVYKIYKHTNTDHPDGMMKKLGLIGVVIAIIYAFLIFLQKM